MSYPIKKFSWHKLRASVLATIGVVAVLVTVTLLTEAPAAHLQKNWLVYFLFVVNAFLLPLHLQRDNLLLPFKRHQDPLSALVIEADTLRVDKRSIELAKINKVVLDKYDAKSAFLHFPYNAGGKVGITFPAEQLTQVRAFLRQYLPDAEVIR